MKWHRVDIIPPPKNRVFDGWVKSKNNPNYCRRAINISYVGDGDELVGHNVPNEEFGEYLSHWMQMESPAPIYRLLEVGEEIKSGDEMMLRNGEWVKAECAPFSSTASRRTSTDLPVRRMV